MGKDLARGSQILRANAGSANITENSFNIDALLDALAERVAAKVRGELGNGQNGAGIKPRLLTVKQAGEYLSRSEDGIRNLIKAGILPTVKLDSRVFLDVRDLDRIIDQAKEVAV